MYWHMILEKIRNQKTVTDCAGDTESFMNHEPTIFQSEQIEQAEASLTELQNAC